MKKIICIILCFIIAAAATGCIGEEAEGENIKAENDEKERVSIITTIFPPYDFAREIAGDKADIRLLLTPGSDAHSFEPTPRDIIDIQNCDLFIYAGGENEKWVTEMTENLNLDSGRIISMLELVEPLQEDNEACIDHCDHHEYEHGEHHSREGYDEHVWTSPQNAMAIAEAIGERLMETDPDNGEYYKENTEKYKSALMELDEKFRDVTALGKRDTLVFADRFPARYFVEEYGLKYYAAFPGCSAESEASPKTVAALVDRVKEENIPVVLSIELSNGKLAEAVAEATGAKHMTFTSCHNLTREEFENGETYISLMENNLETLKEALN